MITHLALRCPRLSHEINDCYRERRLTPAICLAPQQEIIQKFLGGVLVKDLILLRGSGLGENISQERCNWINDPAVDPELTVPRPNRRLSFATSINENRP